jgi:hypothetical protein
LFHLPIVNTDMIRVALKCCFSNARGLFSNMDELRAQLIGSNFSVVGVAETWLNGNKADAEIDIYGYKLYREDRSLVKPGKAGGVHKR